jgi:hypothetical protein
MKCIDYYLLNGWSAEFAKLLLADGTEQNRIKTWCKKNPKYDSALRFDRMFRFELEVLHRVNNNNHEAISACEGWEATLIELAEMFGYFYELQEWEIATSEERKAHLNKVAKLARELAETLTEEPHPSYPPVIEFFDDDCVMDVFNLLPEMHRKYSLRAKDYRGALTFYFPDGGQKLPSVLLRLAEYADKKLYETKRIARPNTGHANSRAFALYLAEGINRRFNKIPNEVIAACVCLKYPELENPPNSDTIRDWRGVK